MATNARKQLSNDIPLIAVDSSQISRLGFDPATNTLAVEFIGKPGTEKSIYHFFNFPAEQHASMVAAVSVGNFFYAHVKGKYDFQKIEPATELRKNIVDGQAVEQPDDEVEQQQAAA